jgi:hypothetical protein
LQPLTQVEPSHRAVGFVHLVPQLPQCWGSLAEVSQPGSTSQSRWEASQTHETPLQYWPTPQVTPQAPQFRGEPRAASQPLDGSASQSAKPGAHPHCAPWQICWGPQDVWQLPQWFLSEVMSASHPSSSTPLQSRRLVGHTQAPAAQVAPTGQVASQLPQCVASDRTSVSQPLAALPSQSWTPPTQVEQTPPAQSCPGQVLPQAPQLDGLVAVSTQVPPQAAKVGPRGLHGEMHWWPEQISSAAHWLFEQQASQLTPEQHSVPDEQPSWEQLIPSGAQLSTVQPWPSEQSPSLQQTLQAPPQSFGRLAPH